jgi:hypothetical protein
MPLPNLERISRRNLIAPAAAVAAIGFTGATP